MKWWNKGAIHPSLPSGWAALSWEQLVEVWKIYSQVHGERTRFHVAVFCYFLGLPPAFKWQLEDGMLHIRTRREHFLLSIDDLEYYAFSSLAWLDEPYHLSALPCEFVKVGHICYKLPSPNLLNNTWQQFNNMQRIMTALWSAESRMRKLLLTPLPKGREAANEALRDIKQKVESSEREILDLRAQFLAHSLLAPTLALTETRDNSTRLHPHKMYRYSVADAKAQVDNLRHAPDWLFNIIYQVVQSSLAFYSKQFPGLFKSSGSGHNRRNELTAEVGTINAVMKYNGYHDQQDVYDSNAIFVFEILNTMTREAEEVKRITKKK